jgi:hypothetical protein
MKTLQKLMEKPSSGVSPIFGMVLALAIIIGLIGILQSYAVPIWNSEIESKHYLMLNDQIKQIPSILDNAEATKTSATVYLDLGVEYPQRMFLFSPPTSGTTISTYNNTVFLTYTEQLPNGTTRVVNKTFNTSSFIVKPNYYYSNPKPLVYELGSIFLDDGSDSPVLSPVNMISGSTMKVYVISTNIGTFSGTETFVLSIQPLSVGSMISTKNSTLNFTTRFPDRWERVFNALGYTVSKNPPWVNVTIDSPLTISLPYFVVTKDIVGAEKLQPYKIIKLGVDTSILTGQSIELGVKVVDYYDNPVPGEAISVNVTGTGYILPDKVNNTTIVTGSNGIAEVTFSAEYPGTAKIWMNSSVGNVSYTITVSSGSGPPVAMTLDLLSEPSGVMHYRLTAHLEDMQGIPQPDYNVSFATNPFTVSVDPMINKTDINGNASSIAGLQACTNELQNTTFGAFSKVEPWGTPYDIVSNLTLPNYPWESGWKYKRNITITSPEAKTNTNVVLTFTSDNFDFSSSNGDDLRFFANYTRTVYELPITLRAYPVYELPVLLTPPSFDIKRVNITIKRDGWWNSSWNYRIPITFEEGGKKSRIELNSSNFDFSKSDGSDLRFIKTTKIAEIPVKITSSYSIAGYQLLLNITDPAILSLIKDGSDIRFYESQVSNPYAEPYTGIPYWIENLTNSYAKIWVKVDVLAGEKIIYMYAGKRATPKSSFDGVFTKDPDAPSDTGLIAEYHLDEGSGTIAGDDTSNNYNGVLQNNPQWQSEDGGVWDSREDVKFSVGSALRFTSSDDRMQLPNSVLNGRTEVSFECWINTTDDTFAIISGANSGQANEYLIFYTSNRLYQFIKGSSRSVSVTLNDGKWHHLVVVRHSNGTIDYFVDSVLMDSDSGLSSSPLVIDPNGLWIASEQDSVGGGWDPDQEFEGIIDEIKVYSRALSQQEVRAHFERRIYAVQPQVDIWYPVSIVNETFEEIPYFVEYWNGNIDKAVVWVESQNDTVYMYYGNPSAQSESNGSGVFRFFDDFEVWNGWTNYSSGWVEQFNLSGDMVLRKYKNNDPNGGYKQIGFTTSNFILVYRDYRRSGDDQGGGYNRVSLEDSGFNGYGALRRGYTSGNGDFRIERRTSASGTSLVYDTAYMPMNNWYTLILTRSGSTLTAYIYNEEGLIKSITTTDTTYSLFDRVAVRGGYTYYLQFVGVDDFNGFSEYTIGSEEGVNWYGWVKVRVPSSFSSTSDGRDIRFFSTQVSDPYAGGHLNHNLSLNGSYFDIWVEIPQSSAFSDEKTIYMYYGYPMASQITMPPYQESNMYAFHSSPVSAGVKYLPLGDYQIPIEITDENVLIRMSENGEDIRVFEDQVSDPYTNVTGKIPYWIESKNSSYLKIWIKTTLNSPKTVYIYYGDESATSESNGESVFDFFDDFSSSIINSSKWEEVNSITYSTGDYLRVSGAVGWISPASSGSYLVARWNKGTLPDSFAVEWKQRVEDVDAGERGQLGVALIQLGGSIVVFAGTEDSSNAVELSNVLLTDSSVVYSSSVSSSVEERFRLERNGDDYRLYKDGSYLSTATTSTTPYSLAIGAGQNGDYLDLALVDYIMVRKYSPYDSMVSYSVGSPTKISYTSGEVLKPFKIIIEDQNVLSHIATSDGRDIRFFSTQISDPYSTTSNRIPFYIEELNSDRLAVWLKYEFIGEKTIYMYYGDQSASEQLSDPSAVFTTLDGVIGLWDFENVSGGVVYDKSPLSNNGQMFNGVFEVTGVKGKAVEFDGVNDYIEVQDDPYLSPQDNNGNGDTGELTIAGWVKVLALDTDSHAQTRQPIVSKGDTGEWEYALYVYDNYHFGFSLWRSSGASHTEIVDTTHTFELNKWYFVVGVYKNGVENKIYIFNETSYIGVYSETTQNGQPGDGSSPLRIGSRNDGQFLKAVIDDVIMFNRTLNFSELEQIKDSKFIKAGGVVAIGDTSRSPEVTLGSETTIANGTDLKYCPYDVVEWSSGYGVVNISIPYLSAGDNLIEMYYGYDRAYPEECNITNAITLPYIVGQREEI